MQPVLGEAKPTAQSARAHHQLMSLLLLLLLLLLHDDDVTSRRGDRLGKFLEIPTSDASAAEMQRCHLASKICLIHNTISHSFSKNEKTLV